MADREETLETKSAPGRRGFYAFRVMSPRGTQGFQAEEELTELHVCHRCLVRLDASAGGVDLPRRLKATLAARGLAASTRVIPAGCLGHCPQGRVTVLVSPESGRGAHAQLIDPEKDGEDLAEHLSRGRSRAARP
jgi:(2Fe-2S) ferredoxin